jgi:hypothetical protein
VSLRAAPTLRSGGTVSFKYDPFGRRIYKSSSVGISIYAYDDDNAIEETNSTGAPVARHSDGLNIDAPPANFSVAARSLCLNDLNGLVELEG